MTEEERGRESKRGEERESVRGYERRKEMKSEKEGLEIERDKETGGKRR